MAAPPKSDKSVLISGGARGIGRCLARTFLEQGHRVFIFDIDENELNHTTNVHLKKHTDAGRLQSSICNLRDVQDIRDKVKQAADFFGGRIDVLINNGGIASPRWKDGKTMEDLDTISEWQAYVETNLTAPFAVSQACIPYMKTQNQADTADDAKQDNKHIANSGPCILHIGSFRAHQSDPNQEGYASTKSGQLGLMHSMAISCEPWGIRVNLIAPGRIKVVHESKEGDENGTGWHDTLEDKDMEQHPTNRPGMPEDIAQAAQYLIEAGFVTGQEITVDGGALKKKNK
ncbi:short chain dehydrogenase [Saccharata proteae CBS 121410]|uniref:Short chain dehydrogenase n=1 Tax=Saccharata proteae CBS 121410 TaxID=1314787 RepID=A0A9P4HSC8_9PEZI|nr:short chain dehydrogenase [Saccharata proteae CBS 121410]